MTSSTPHDAEETAPISPEDILANPGYLKLELMRWGIRLHKDAQDALVSPESGPSAFGNYGDVDLALPQDTWVSVPADTSFSHHSPYLLRPQGEGFAVHHQDTGEEPDAPQTAVQVIPHSALYNRHTSNGTPLSSFATVHGSFLAISPIPQCDFFGSDNQCRFCSLTPHNQLDPHVGVEDVLEAIRIAREDQRIDLVFLNVGYFDGDDSGVRTLEPYVRAIKKNFDILVAVDALPPAINSWIDRTYAMGVDSISYNLEIFDPNRFEEVCPGPARTVGRQRFLDALEYASGVFPSGAVICHLIVGVDSLESTRNGIDALISRGVVPVLPVFRPFKGKDLREGQEGDQGPSLSELSVLYGELYQKLKAQKINMSWVRNISVITTPAEGRFFVEKGGVTGLLNKWVGHNRKPSATLSDWRRALRVKEVDDSFKSSGL